MEDICFVTCNCGCGNGFVCKKAFGLVYIDAVSGTFSSEQESIFDKAKDKFGYIKTLAKKEKVYLHDICLSEKELEDFLDNLEEVANSHPDEFPDKEDVENETDKLHLSCFNDGHDLLFILDIKSDLTFKDILFNKEYRQYELYVTKETCLKFVGKARRFLDKERKIQAEKAL
jgi:hypothetical protein